MLRKRTTDVLLSPSPEDKLQQYDDRTKELNFDRSTLLTGIKALKQVLELKKQEKQKLLDIATPIFLQIGSIKVPICPSRTLRLPVKHSLLDEDCSICFIVGDIKTIIKKEHEKVVEHYEKFLKDNGVDTKIEKIMPLHELKNDYGEFEMKRKLLCSYDLFLVDAKISKYVSKHLGKIFVSKRCLPIPIRLERGMAKQIKYGLLKTSMNMHKRGDNYCVQVGNTKMTVPEIYENIVVLCEALSKEYPGGWDNVKVINLKTDLSMAIPIYFSLKNPAEVKVPKIKPKRPKAFKVEYGELSTKLNADVKVYPTGEVIVKNSKRRKHE